MAIIRHLHVSPRLLPFTVRRPSVPPSPLPLHFLSHLQHRPVAGYGQVVQAQHVERPGHVELGLLLLDQGPRAPHPQLPILEQERQALHDVRVPVRTLPLQRPVHVRQRQAEVDERVLRLQCVRAIVVVQRLRRAPARHQHLAVEHEQRHVEAGRLYFLPRLVFRRQAHALRQDKLHLPAFRLGDHAEVHGFDLAQHEFERGRLVEAGVGPMADAVQGRLQAVAVGHELLFCHKIAADNREPLLIAEDQCTDWMISINRGFQRGSLWKHSLAQTMFTRDMVFFE